MEQRIYKTKWYLYFTTSDFYGKYIISAKGKFLSFRTKKQAKQWEYKNMNCPCIACKGVNL